MLVMTVYDNDKNSPRVLVAMSGGVDSSVSAALLQAQGYQVTGAFIQVWQPPFLECRWEKERDDARAAAGRLGIPFTTVDLRETYKREVVDYMINEYRRGRTPNPDVMCNLFVKFGGFLTEAKRRGAEYIATGHYIRKYQDQDSKFQIQQGVDDKKDQSYFLWQLGQEQLTRSLFPVGDKLKSETRELAHCYNLPTAEKKDSQGVCFLGQLDMKEFLARYVAVEPGPVLDVNGRVIGQHRGAVLYTRGERRGFEVTDKGPDQPPLYVVDKDLSANTITVASRQSVKDSYYVNSVVLEGVNWISGSRPPAGEYQARFRHQQSPRPIRLEYSEGQVTAIFQEPQTAVSEGQSLVIYQGEVCLGGGVISQLLN